MKSITWIVNNWALIVVLLVAVIAAIAIVVKFFKLPKGQQMEKVREWLKFAVVKAEQEFKEPKTGALKLRNVYDWFVSRFPFMSMIISFNEFSKLVDEALVWMNEQLETNKNIEAVIKQ